MLLSAGDGPYARHRHYRHVAHGDLCVPELEDCRVELGVIFVSAGTIFQVLQRDASDSRDQAIHQLSLCHLKADHQNRPSLLDGHVCCDIHCQGGFTHCRAASNDNHLSRLQALRVLV